MFAMMRGVNQGDGPSRFRNSAYVDDDIFEEVFRHTVYPAEILPTCRRAASGHSCPADSRDCRYGVAVLALTWTPLLFTNDDNKVMVEIDRGWHLFNWCSGNIFLFGIEKLDPPPLPVPQDYRFFTMSTQNLYAYTWQALNPVMPGGNPITSTRLRRRCQQGLPVCTIEDFLVYPHRVQVPPLLRETATHHHLFLTMEPIDGPLLASAIGRIVDV
jgi:hypothetical protein